MLGLPAWALCSQRGTECLSGLSFEHLLRQAGPVHLREVWRVRGRRTAVARLGSWSRPLINPQFTDNGGSSSCSTCSGNDCKFLRVALPSASQAPSADLAAPNDTEVRTTANRQCLTCPEAESAICVAGEVCLHPALLSWRWARGDVCLWDEQGDGYSAPR